MQIVSAEEKAQLDKKREDLYKAQLDVQERINKAAALGDLSENAEYHFAKEENRTIQRQLAELELNPLLAGPDGALALDARVVLRQPSTSRR